jgi:hypothetical protein
VKHHPPATPTRRIQMGWIKKPQYSYEPYTPKENSKMEIEVTVKRITNGEVESRTLKLNLELLLDQPIRTTSSASKFVSERMAEALEFWTPKPSKEETE